MNQSIVLLEKKYAKKKKKFKKIILKRQKKQKNSRFLQDNIKGEKQIAQQYNEKRVWKWNQLRYPRQFNSTKTL